MYLTKIELEMSDSGVQRALRDGQQMHRLVCSLFNASRNEAELLYRSRIKGMIAELYLYSAVPINPSRNLLGIRLIAQRDITPWLDSLTEGGVYSFQLETVPFKKISENGIKNSRRRSLRTKEEREDWIRRKANQNGFEVLFVNETMGTKHSALHAPKAGGKLIMDSWLFTGGLRITDLDLFRKALRQGIGPGKAYGLGMLFLVGGGINGEGSP